ncbi:MAG: ester cyclase [Actinobacteria bacterium]|nr:MAG: ester cyclase [Actinomycetota bacterium]
MPESVAASHLREVLDALSAHDLDRVGDVVDEKFEFMDVGGGDTVHSRDEWRAFCDVFVTAFPDLTQEVQLLVDAGEYAFAEVVARGTHTGPLATPEGDIGPTGRTIEVPFCVVMHARDGLLVDGREYYDAATLLRQLGLASD